MAARAGSAPAMGPIPASAHMNQIVDETLSSVRKLLPTAVILPSTGDEITPKPPGNASLLGWAFEVTRSTLLIWLV